MKLEDAFIKVIKNINNNLVIRNVKEDVPYRFFCLKTTFNIREPMITFYLYKNQELLLKADEPNYFDGIGVFEPAYEDRLKKYGLSLDSEGWYIPGLKEDKNGK